MSPTSAIPTHSEVLKEMRSQESLQVRANPPFSFNTRDCHFCKSKMAKCQQFQPIHFLPFIGGDPWPWTWSPPHPRLRDISSGLSFCSTSPYIQMWSISDRSLNFGLGRSSALRSPFLCNLLWNRVLLLKDHILTNIGDRMRLREFPRLNRLWAPESLGTPCPPNHRWCFLFWFFSFIQKCQ